MPIQSRDLNRSQNHAPLAHPPLWVRSLAQPAMEFGPLLLPVRSGQIPDLLRGTLYRNGPGRLERSGQKVEHWFDGDGAILAVHFTAAGATGLYRYVQTQEFQAEERADQFLYSGYGQLAPGPWWRRWGTQPKNAANTSVLALPDRLLALWEGGHPHALDLETLATQGPEFLGTLHPQQTYSAHPKRDPQTGDLYNFGVTYGLRSHLNLYRSDASGQIRQQAQIPLDRVALIHDFAIAGPYLVFLIPPVVINLMPVLLGLQGFSDSLHWHPQQGTEIMVIDRTTFTVVTRITTDPWYQWHCASGYLAPDDSLVIDYIRYANFETNRWLQEVATGYPHTPAPSQLWRLRLDLKLGKIMANEPYYDPECEFPTIAPLEIGRQPSALYLSSLATPKVNVAETFDSIARLDLHHGGVTLAQFGQGCYPSEPLYVSDPQEPDQGWIVTVVFDGHQDQSTVQIFSAQQLDMGPIGVLELPEVIPLGFHGTWRSAA